MSTLIKCFSCAKPYRLRDDVPESFTCTKCGEVMDLSRYARTDEEGADSASSGAASRAGSGRAGRPPKAPVARKKSSTVGSVIVGILMLGVAGMRIAQCSSRNSDSSGTYQVDPATLDQLLHQNETFEERQRRLETERMFEALRRRAAEQKPK